MSRTPQHHALREARYACSLDASRTALRDLVSANGDYHTCDRPQKALVGHAASLGETAGDVAAAPLSGEDSRIMDAIG